MKISYKNIDLNNWNRKEAFECFLKFKSPQVDVCFDLEIAHSFKYCKQNNISFFDFMLFNALKTANQIENFRFRIRDGKPIVHEIVHPDWVVMNEDHSISTRCSEYSSDFNTFSDNRVNKSKILSFGEDECLDHLIFCSCTPWLDFISVTQAIHNSSDCIPKLVWGKANGNKIRFSIQVHHSLVDAWHISQFKDLMQKNILEFLSQ